MNEQTNKQKGKVLLPPTNTTTQSFGIIVQLVQNKYGSHATTPAPAVR